jgi:hypothetical protein
MMLTGLLALAAVAAAPQGALTLAPGAGSGARTAVLAEAKRQDMTEVTISDTQSFRVLERGREVATLLTGAVKFPDAVNAGCFVATVQSGEPMPIPTLGYGDYEAEPCGGPIAVGVLSSGPVTKLGFVFRSYSREAEEAVPIVIDWDRSNNTLLIDENASKRADLAGARTIVRLRQLMR